MSNIQMHINVVRGEVMVTFGQSVSWLSWPPAGARELGEALIKMAAEAEKFAKPDGVVIQ